MFRRLAASPVSVPSVLLSADEMSISNPEFNVAAILATGAPTVSSNASKLRRPAPSVLNGIGGVNLRPSHIPAVVKTTVNIVGSNSNGGPNTTKYVPLIPLPKGIIEIIRLS